MTNEEFIILAEKVAEGSASISEIALYDASYESFQQDPQSLTADGLDSKELKKESLARFWKNRGDSKRVVKLWPGFGSRTGRTGLVAAAAVAAVVFGVWFFNYRTEIRRDALDDKNAIVNDIAPGKNGATITLANGQVIQLSDAKAGVVIGGVLKYSDGSDVRYSSGSRSSGPASPGQRSTGPVGVRSLTPSDLQGAEGEKDKGLPGAKDKGLPGAEDKELQGVNGKNQSLIASTAKGQTYQFTLPDGTKVWLNADSKLEFPSNFVNGKTRYVRLSGEGYFEVAKVTLRSPNGGNGRRPERVPFIVATTRQQIEVLGTHFNVSAYAGDAPMKTTLLEGKVAVTDGGSRLTLHPGDQAYSGLDGIRAKTLSDPEAEIDWKNGDFIFRNEALESIMSRVARWYNVEVVYAPGVDRMQSFSGSVSRSKPVSAILGIIQLTKQVKFKIEGKKVYVGK